MIVQVFKDMFFPNKEKKTWYYTETSQVIAR